MIDIQFVSHADMENRDDIMIFPAIPGDEKWIVWVDQNNGSIIVLVAKYIEFGLDHAGSLHDDTLSRSFVSYTSMCQHLHDSLKLLDFGVVI